jgi:N-acetylmuramoyl-L-alanine amidase
MMYGKILIILISICLLALSSSRGASVSEAQENGVSDVKIRAARHADFVRIVVTSEESLFKKSSAVLDSNKAIIIDFRPETAAADKGKKAVAVQTDKGAVKEGMPVEILKSVSLTLKGTVLAISVPNIRDIKVLKLQSPSRMVIDAFFTSAPRDDASQSAAFKALADPVAFRTFVIDAGHGGFDYGIRGARFVEKDFTLAFARDLAGILARSGRDAVLTRKTDLVMTLSERIGVANKKMPDIFIIFHVSSTKVPTVYVIPDRTEEGGTVVGQKKREISKNIAEAIANSIEKEFSISVVRESLPLPLLTRSRPPAVIVELPNPDEFSFEKKNRDRMLSAVIKGLSAGTREDRQPGPIQKPEARTETKPEVKTVVPPAVKPETKTDKKPEKKPEQKPGAKQGDIPEGMKESR